MMTPRSITTLLIVDDNLDERILLSAYLEKEDYRIIEARNGMEAWALLEGSPDVYDTVILDRRMPLMDGMELLTKMKHHDILKRIPVIFLTGMSEQSDIIEGLQAGVDYYLTKPLKQDILIAVVKTALNSYLTYKSMWQNICQTTDALALMKTGRFEFQNIDEGKMLTTLLASLFPDPSRVAIGLWELLLNAVEHGNLGISYEEKARLVEADEWHIEVRRRMALPENLSKTVTVDFERTESETRFLIQDQGKGFNWMNFMDFTPDRAFDLNGRGIHLARSLSFDRVEYNDAGNQVLAVIWATYRPKDSGK
jgi:DNA-binding response OmpR family regulator